MDIPEYRTKAREHISSGTMTEEEWDDILRAILSQSDAGGMEHFDQHMYSAREFQREYPAKHEENLRR